MHFKSYTFHDEDMEPRVASVDPLSLSSTSNQSEDRQMRNEEMEKSHTH